MTSNEMRVDGSRSASRFEQWTQTRPYGLSSRKLAPRWLLVSYGAAVAVMLSAGIFKSGVMAGSLFALGALSFALLFVREYVVIAAKGRRYLASRDDLPDEFRVVLLVGLCGAAAVGGLLMFFGVALVLRLIRGF